MVLPTPAREIRQARKGATVAVAGVWRGHPDQRATAAAGQRRRFGIVIVLGVIVLGVAPASLAQDTEIIIETPPAQEPAPAEPRDQPTPPTAVAPTPPPAPLGPDGITVHGTPVRLKLRGSQPGVGFHLTALRSETSTFGYGIEYGFGYPYGYGYGYYGYPYGYGYGGYGYWAIAPYSAQTTTQVFRPICQAPCEISIRSGQHPIAISLEGGPPIQAGVIDVSTPATVIGHYESRKKLRRIGWIVFGVGVIAGTVMVATSLSYDTFDDDIRSPPLFGTGMGVLFGSIIAGSVLASKRDRVGVEVQPY